MGRNLKNYRSLFIFSDGSFCVFNSIFFNTLKISEKDFKNSELYQKHSDIFKENISKFRYREKFLKKNY